MNRHIVFIGSIAILSLLVVTFASVPASGPIRLVKDINETLTQEASSFPFGFARLGGITLFAATSPDVGYALWKTDGTAAGTSLVKDVNPSPNGFLDQLTTLGGFVYFTANDGVHGTELWRTDGTETGTVLVKDIRPGPLPSFVGASLTAFNGSLYFKADDGAHGLELWKSDGTEAGTVLVKDTFPESAFPEGSNGTELLFRVAGDHFFFMGLDREHGQELWKSDGTEAGTVLVKDIDPGSGSGLFGGLVNAAVIDGTLYFTAFELTHGQGLWKSDGTEAGTVLVKDVTPGALEPFLREVTASGGRLFFVSDDQILGSRLWTSDGTEAGTVVLRDIVPGTWNYDFELTDVDGTLHFLEAYGYPTEVRLWKTDGTEAGTVLVKNMTPPPGSWGARSLTSFQGHLVFLNDDGVHGLELWTSDGTPGGTVMLRDLDPGIRPAFPYYGTSRPDLTDLDGTLWFAADDGSHGAELGKSDGTPAGTLLVKEINAFAQTVSSFPGARAEMNGTLFFGAFDGIHGGELWRTDGTSGGTVLVKDVLPGPDSSQLGSFTALGATLYFAAEDATHGRELWRTDGTEAGTVLVKDINEQVEDDSPQFSDPSTPFAWNGRVFFAANDGLHGRELWKSDGTERVTALVKDINPETIPAGVFGSFSSIGGTLVFVADDGVHGFEIWRTDGTEEGTVLVKDIHPGPTQSLGGPAFDRAEVGGSILFRASDPAHGQELWKTDGTEAGTVLVKDFCPGPCAGFNSLLTNRPVIAGNLYFTHGAAVAGGPSIPQLWKTDGTDEGTVLVKAFQPGTFFSIQQLTDAGGTLFFLADDGIHGIEPWTSDGTEEGTVFVKDIRPGASHSNDTGNRTLWVATPSGIVYFTADDGVHGIELWRSDGTEEGTFLVKDIAPGLAGSLPTQITAIDGALLFKADDGVHGVEPWRSDGTEEGTVLVGDVSTGPRGSGTFFSSVEPTILGNRLVLSLDDESHGFELWSGRAAVVTGQPVRAIQDLRGELDGLHLPGGLGRVLAREVDEAAAAAADPTRSQAAIAALERFRRKVEALSRHMISDVERASLVEFARDIIGLLGASPGSTRHATGWEASRP